MTVLAWILAAAVWLACALAIGLLFGGLIRRAEAVRERLLQAEREALRAAAPRNPLDVSL